MLYGSLRCNFEIQNAEVMDPYSTTQQNIIKVILVITIITISILVSNPLAAQHRSRPGQKMYLGVEGSIGTRSFSIESDIPAINRMPVSTEGANFGLVFGNKIFHTKIKQGYFKSSASVSEKLKLIESEGLINVYPLQLRKTKFRYFEPYFVTGLERSTTILFGTYVSERGGMGTAGTGNSGSGSQTGSGSGTGTETGHVEPVVCEGGLPANPDGTTPAEPAPPTDPNGNPDNPDGTQGTSTGTDPLTQEQPYLGRVINTRTNVGLGLECHIPGKHHFVNLFAELKYGIPISAKTSDTAFRNTKVSSMLAVNFGISFGFAR